MYIYIYICIYIYIYIYIYIFIYIYTMCSSVASEPARVNITAMPAKLSVGLPCLAELEF